MYVQGRRLLHRVFIDYYQLHYGLYCFDRHRIKFVTIALRHAFLLSVMFHTGLLFLPFRHNGLNFLKSHQQIYCLSCIYFDHGVRR